MCPSREDREIGSQLGNYWQKDQELLALVEDYQIPLLMEPVQEKVLKEPKLNQQQQKQVGLEVKAMFGKGLHFKSLSLKRGIFEKFQ